MVGLLKKYRALPGLDGVCSIYQGHLFFQKANNAHMWLCVFLVENQLRGGWRFPESPPNFAVQRVRDPLKFRPAHVKPSRFASSGQAFETKSREVPRFAGLGKMCVTHPLDQMPSWLWSASSFDNLDFLLVHTLITAEQ